MDITECRVKPTEDGRLLAYATLVFDESFLVSDVKLIDGPDGTFLAMPSRKVRARCPACAWKNPVRQPCCGGCGARLGPVAAPDCGLHADVCHPIRPDLREAMHTAVWEAYRDGAPVPLSHGIARAVR